MIYLLGVLIIVILILSLSYLSRGAIFVPTHISKLPTILKFAKVKPGERAADLGSGDGRVVIALATAGAFAEGYETNPLLVWWARRKIKKLGLTDHAKIYLKNFWRADLSQYDIVFVFGIDHIMRRLENKLHKELKPGARVVSFIFEFPSWQPSLEQSGVRLYNIKANDPA